MALEDVTRAAADDLVEALRPLDATAKAMFGGYCYYLGGKVVGLVCDGRVFVKRSRRDDLLSGWAQLAPAYPGAKNSWRLPTGALVETPERVREVIEQVAAVLPARTPRRRASR
jgi:TfoX/Sxy family transcriptional regulator of competence genes